MTDERHLLEAIRENPTDTLQRGIYADWLRDNERADDAEIVANGGKTYLTYTESRSGGEAVAGQENDPWADHEDEEIDWRLTGCFKTQPSGLACVTPDDDMDNVAVGTDAFVVYVRYTTGSTFGSTRGCGTVVAVKATRESADAIATSILNGSFSGYARWTGYFESLESCEVEKMRVQLRPHEV